MSYETAALEMKIEELEEDNAKMEAALRDFADMGLRCDLMPTCSDQWDHLRWHEYLTRSDKHVRERALMALGELEYESGRGSDKESEVKE